MTVNLLGILLLVGAVGLDLCANICLKKSNGFTQKRYGIAALSFVVLSFFCLAHLIRIMDLSIAYAMFGAGPDSDDDCRRPLLRPAHTSSGHMRRSDDDCRVVLIKLI